MLCIHTHTHTHINTISVGNDCTFFPVEAGELKD